MFGLGEKIDDATWRRFVRDGLALLTEGRVRPTIGQLLPLERAADAHAAMQRREVIGKTVLTV